LSIGLNIGCLNGGGVSGWCPASKVDEPGRVMNNKLVNALEAGFSRLQAWRVSKIDLAKLVQGRFSN
jgi:hypothetical protein